MKLEYIIYRAKSDCPYRGLSFFMASEYGICLNDYKEIYRDTIELFNFSITDILDTITVLADGKLGTDFTGNKGIRSSDIIKLTDDEYWYRDQFDWEKITEFTEDRHTTVEVTALDESLIYTTLYKCYNNRLNEIDFRHTTKEDKVMVAKLLIKKLEEMAKENKGHEEDFIAKMEDAAWANMEDD